MAMVARSVSKAEIKEQQAARDAMWAEYSKLQTAKTWDLESVREWSNVAKEARESGGTLKAQVGRVFGICVEKGSELAANDKDRKYKGRFVFGGDFVKDENYQEGIFNDLGSSPASLEGSKAIDALGLLKGNVTEIADAAQAYIQALLGTTAKDNSGSTITVTT